LLPGISALRKNSEAALTAQVQVARMAASLHRKAGDKAKEAPQITKLLLWTRPAPLGRLLDNAVYLAEAPDSPANARSPDKVGQAAMIRMRVLQKIAHRDLPA
jgi:hypothetical protein